LTTSGRVNLRRTETQLLEGAGLLATDVLENLSTSATRVAELSASADNAKRDFRERASMARKVKSTGLAAPQIIDGPFIGLESRRKSHRYVDSWGENAYYHP